MACCIVPHGRAGLVQASPPVLSAEDTNFQVYHGRAASSLYMACRRPEWEPVCAGVCCSGHIGVQGTSRVGPNRG